MRLSAKSRFAVAAMIDLALRESSGPVPLNSIGQRLQISLSYLEQLFSKLRQHGLVESTRGPGGGYTLGRDVKSISVADVIRAIEGARGLQSDESAEGGEAGWQLTHELWNGLSSRMMEHMESIKLHRLCEEQREKNAALGLPRDVAAKPEKPAAKRGIFTQHPVERTKPSAPNSVFALGTLAAAKS